MIHPVHDGMNTLNGQRVLSDQFFPECLRNDHTGVKIVSRDILKGACLSIADDSLVGIDAQHHGLKAGKHRKGNLKWLIKGKGCLLNLNICNFHVFCRVFRVYENSCDPPV